MIARPAPHAVLFVGPDGVGKTTLALDLAAGLLCTSEPPAARPCRSCRACRLVEHGSHPDLHRLGPAGPGRQVVIGGPGGRFRGVRDLIVDLALMPVEGGWRVAIIESADRMNEDAQSALLKTLEEPPPGVTIILCADREWRLMPTVRSRCQRVRLGLVGPRDIEAIIGDHGLADPPTAARLARIAGGRPGLALAYARAPESVLVRAELARTLLDLTDARPSLRLAAARAAIPRAMELATLLAGAEASGPAGTARRGRRKAATVDAGDEATGSLDAGEASDTTEDEPALGGRAVPAAERRRAVELLLALWSSVGRDVVLAGSGGERSIADPVLLEESAAVAAAIPAGSAVVFLERVAKAAELLEANVSPELVMDTIALAWPTRDAAA
jgi:DNA polymerase III subunit delta'